ncbi:hypothetical protein ACEZ3G_00175 [Maribacter algicola]|uniref:Uncharacterized protein n=1 Tax=Meishania litoralis TaxID=3434685 RepID=A0ACC7LEF2_9FLAO
MEHQVISFIGQKAKVMEMIAIDSLFAVLPLSKDRKDFAFYEMTTKSSLQHFTEDSFTKENMDLAHQDGQLIFMNTLWDEDDDFVKGDYRSLDKVISLKPAMIQTDHPKILLEYLRSKNLHE